MSTDRMAIEVSRPPLSKTELIMLARAARNAWPTPPESRAKAISDVKSIIADPAAPERLLQRARETLAVLESHGWDHAKVTEAPQDA